MAITYFPFDSGAGANITEDQWRKMARHWRSTGVLAGEDDEFAVSQSGTPAMSVDVAAGKAWIRGHYVESDAAATKTLSAADVTNDRIDRIVLRVDFGANTITIEVLEGTPAPSPSVPALTQSSSTWEISLAQVLVGNGVSSIVNADITDERTMSRTSTPMVTTLPDNPADGDEVYFTDSLTAPTYVWRLCYSEDVSDANKWVFVGGSALRDFSDASVTHSDGVATGLSVVAPRAGVYRVEWKYMILGGAFWTKVRVNGTDTAYCVVSTSAADEDTLAGRGYEITVGAAGQTVDVVGYFNGGNAASAEYFEFELIPVRVA